jgi:rare lipoprotein A
VLEGVASWYGPRFDGRKTASGERFDQDALTAAHATIDFGTRVRVTNLENGRSVVVRINDRPGDHDRVIDLSRAAGKALGLIHPGTARVRLDLLED